MNLDTQEQIIAVDLDGTLCIYDGWKGATTLGKPVKPMVERVKQWLSTGKKVVIFSARIWPLGTADEKQAPNKADFDDPESYLKAQYAHEDSEGAEDRTTQARGALKAIEDWCEKNLGQVIPVTCIKVPAMIEFWDDRAVAVEANTGKALNQPQIKS